MHRLTSSAESGSGVLRRNSSRAISAEVILSRARTWRVFSAQCSPSMARLNSARAIRICCSCFTHSSDSPWFWHGRKHQHKYRKSEPTQKLKHMYLIKQQWWKKRDQTTGELRCTSLITAAVFRWQLSIHPSIHHLLTSDWERNSVWTFSTTCSCCETASWIWERPSSRKRFLSSTSAVSLAKSL